ncbi:MAG TPA: amidase domain-containing protein [Candidatus Saccharimonadales bacterium]|nr:amidase domain-containing protein [Candidatus Saccharimonadales bacterium]
MRRLRMLAVAATGVVAVLSTQVAGVTPVAADTHAEINIVGNVNLRPSPDTSQTPLTVIQKGDKPDYICFTYGEQVDDVNVWFKVNYNGFTGFYSTRWDDIPPAQLNDIPGNFGISACGMGADMNQTPAEGATIDIGPPAPKPSYDRGKAAAWAYDHATANQPILWSGCTWFASMALWQGGLPMTDDWNDRGTHSGRRVQGTVTATAAPDFVNYLTDIGWIEQIPLDGRFATNAVPEARVGDIIAYSWNGDGYINHLAVIVNIAPGDYPEVAEWGTADVPHRSVSYHKRGWTYSEKHHRWLQEDNPNVTAILLRVAPWS